MTNSALELNVVSVASLGSEAIYPSTPSPFLELIGGCSLSSLDIPALPSPSDFNGVKMVTPFDFWYNRIWIIPFILSPVNPRIGTDYAFIIMNAFEEINTLTSITSTGATGITIDIPVPTTFREIEVYNANLQLGYSAPNIIDAVFTFHFTYGSATLHFVATVSDFVAMLPDEGATETLIWLTQVLTSQNGEEQRVAHRTAPRRAFDFSFILDQPERRQQYRRWHRSLGNRLVVPAYWYAARILANATAGATRIYFNPASTDVRDGDNLVIVNPLTSDGQLVVAATIETDGATLSNALTADITAGMIVSPGFNCRLLDNGGLSMQQISGVVKFQAETLSPRVPFARPGASPTIVTYDGYDVLDRIPVARGDSDETFVVSYELFDGATGIEATDQAWTHPFVSGRRDFRIERERNPAEMDFWRNFLDARRGMQVPFLMSTWQPDLVLAAAPTGNNEIVISSDDFEYETELFPYETYKRLAITSDGGIAYRKVTAVTSNDDGTFTLRLDAIYGDQPGETVVSCVSFLNIVRLGEDSVKLTHDALISTLEMTFRTVDA
jgi:hypothetical protein